MLRTRCAAAGLALLVAGCAGLQRSAPAPERPAVARASFELAGRFSARSGSDGAAGGFAWTHDAARDTLVFSAPTGQALARLDGDAQGVRLELPDGRRETAASWERLTERAVGVPVPVRGLASWVQGLPRAGSPHDEERDASGRLAVLRQDGWQIVYGYRDAPEPSRLVMTYPDVELRLVIDEWR